MIHEPVWGIIIAGYLFLAGLGSGAFITSAFLGWRYPEAVNMRRVGYFIAPIAIMIGLVLLMVDAEGGLYNPLRFSLLLTNFASVMTWGVVFLAIFVVIALLVAVLVLRKKKVPSWLDGAGVLFALCVAIYTGVLLGVCKTYPLWNNALLPILFLVSAISAGAAAVLLFSKIKYPHEFNQVTLLKKSHFWLPLVEIVFLASLMFITFFNSTAGSGSVMNLLAGEHVLLFWIGLIAVGLVAPTVLEAALLFFVPREFEESRKAHFISMCSDVGVLCGGFLLRYLIVIAVVPIF